MASTLVVTNRPVEYREHGYDLRVANLCRQLGNAVHLLVVPIDAYVSPSERNIDARDIFASVTDVGRDGLDRPSALRHLRLSEFSYLSRAHPRFFARSLQAMREAVARTGADRLIVFGSGLAGLAAATGHRSVLLDVCDSASLALRRRLDFAAAGAASGGHSTSDRLALHRSRACEGRLPRVFARVTTINDADSDEVRSAAGSPAPTNVHTVPNGVELSEAPCRAQEPPVHGVAFWGNLAFAPNREALRYFFRHVYAPHLQGSGVRICIVGRGAEPWLVELAAQDPNIELMGFVDDLTGVIRRYPVMINPMVIGSGMKNKVLEAFAAGLAVVSTTLGMESIVGAVAGTHHVVADVPAEFAAAVRRLLSHAPERRRLTEGAARLVAQRYTWRAVGAGWRALHDDLLAAQRGAALDSRQASIV